MKRAEYVSPSYELEIDINDIIMGSTQVDEDGSYVGIVDIEEILGTK